MGHLENRERAARAHHAAQLTLPVVLLLTVSGCTLVNDSKVTQCQTDNDCLSRFGGDVGVSCIASYCVAPSCAEDSQCQLRGERYTASVCSKTGVCASAAAAAAACSTVADCHSLSPAIACNDGVCEDKIWGCAGQPDERSALTQPSATFQGRVIDLSTRKPVPELHASACLLPAFDPDCAHPFPGTVSSYELDAGTLTLTGIPQDTQVRLKIDFAADAGLLPLDQYSARTAHDLTMMPTLITQPLALAPRLTLSLDPPRVRDPANASITAVVTNCQNEVAVGVQVRVAESDRLLDTEVFYFDSEGQIKQGATATDAFGTALIINVKPAKLVTLQVWTGELMLNEYRVMGFPGRSTAVNFFPRAYPDLTAGGG